ncbi:S8 family serine peptidase [Alteromonas sp. NFXS44]|uniref:S8 family peptidase n=1 Tax=Alteromonas sp. NFXS44 TaxID=2818435 RepID=UPI0032DFBA41
MKKFTLSALAAAMITLPAKDALADAYIGEQMQTTLTTLAENTPVMAVVTYEQLDPLAETQIRQLLDLGITEGVQFKTLPIIGVLATKSQIEQIAAMDGVRSVFANRPVKFFNEVSRQITGVDQLQSDDFITRNGMSFTGKGVTIMVNDSGIDATHQDLFFGDKVVENVQAATHAQALSLTGVTNGFTLTGQPNTDLNSGHGTHCAGTIAGNGVMSDGKHKGAAPDADLVGYGSGGGVLILDSLGGFDFAISNLYSYDSPIKVISNSWGSSGKYEPLGPVSMATYKAHKLGILSVFAAGNDGPGEDSHNPYAQIPWGMSVGAGDKSGKLADFSSRGLASESGSFTMPDGTEWTYNNDVTIVAPGVDIISARASTNLVANGGDADLGAMEAEYVPFYTMISGTSMATPHVAGIVALMLEANPELDNLTIKKLLQDTATNMPGYERWEVGAGYVNAKAAVAAALDYDMDYSVTVNNLAEKTFNTNSLTTESDDVTTLDVFYSPVGEPDIQYFEVGDDVALVKAAASTLANLTKLVLVAPDGTEYFGNLTTPVLSENMRVSAPGMAGTWGVYVYGLTSLSGVQADPLGLTNGPGLPESFSVDVTYQLSGGFQGMDDVEGHPYAGAIEFAVSERLMDGLSPNKFSPDSQLKRHGFATYAVMGGAVRQYRDLLNEPAPGHSGIPKSKKPYMESVLVSGGALKDTDGSQNPVLLADMDVANTYGTYKRLDAAYSFVQMLGLQDVATAFDPADDIIVEYKGEQIVLADQDSIPDELKGYVQLAITLSLVNVEFGLTQGQFDLTPSLTASFDPDGMITRAHYAVLASRFFTQYYQ